MQQFNLLRLRLLDSTLAVALISATSYAAAFLFEAGYLDRFGVNPDLAEVQFKSILVALPIVVLLLLGLAVSLWLVNAVVQSTVGMKRRFILRHITLAFYLALLVAGIPHTPAYDGREMFIAIIFAMLIFELPFVLCWWGLYRWKYTRAYIRRVSEAFLRRVTGRWASLTLILFAAYFVLLLAAYSVTAGRYAADVTSSAPWFKLGGQPVIAIRQYGAYWLCLNFDPQTHKIDRSTYHFILLQDKAGFELQNVTFSR